MRFQKCAMIISTLLFAVACGASDPAPEAKSDDAATVHEATQTITTITADGVTVYGEPYFSGLDASAPLILLFHQGGSNGRGEYSDIAAWLNENGFRAIAWDQRAGGETYGESNRTVAGLPEGADPGYCDAAPDLQAAVDYVAENNLAERVILWGSSYSAALIFGTAAANPDMTGGVIAFSPASGGPLENCRARMWADEIDAPMFVLRPASEMERESSVEQRDILTAAGAAFLVVENGVHGSSMLLDARTENDMSEARAEVLTWLQAAVDN